jgi:hypothetical protein
VPQASSAVGAVQAGLGVQAALAVQAGLGAQGVQAVQAALVAVAALAALAVPALPQVRGAVAVWVASVEVAAAVQEQWY